MTTTIAGTWQLLCRSAVCFQASAVDWSWLTMHETCLAAACTTLVVSSCLVLQSPALANVCCASSYTTARHTHTCRFSVDTEAQAPTHDMHDCLTALVPFQVNGQKGTLAARAIEANRHKCSVSAAALGMCARCRHKQPMSCNSWNCPACLRVRSEMGLFEEHGRSSRSIPRV